MVDDIVNSIDIKQHCAALFVDLSNAFDAVNDNILLNKLLSIGIEDSAYIWFKGYFSSKVQTVVADGLKSSSWMVDKGKKRVISN